MHHFPLKLKLRIDWSEMDLLGHINNVQYFKYVQASRINYWENTVLNKMYKEEKIGPLLASTNCQFKKPLHYPGEIFIQASVESIKNTGFGIYHQIIDQHGVIAAEAHDVLVVYDFNKNEKVTIPDALRKEIETLEKRKFTLES